MSAARNLANTETTSPQYVNAFQGNTEIPTTPFRPVGLRNYAGPRIAGDAACEIKNPTLLTQQDLLSVFAIVAHISYSQDINQEALLRLIEAEFSVDHIKKIPQRQFHDVMEFLMCLRMDGVRSRR